jgi:ATP phosphoribosyltransferase
LLKETISIFEGVGINCSELKQQGRKLLFQSHTSNISFILVKAADVLTYVEHGVADLGVIGSDLLLENEKECYEILDLGIGRCTFCVASTVTYEPKQSKRRIIATKYPTIASNYFRGKGEEVDIIKIEGSVEIAPLLGLADAIVDIVETGQTLRENGLVIFDEIHDVSAQLIVNKASLKMKKEAVFHIIDSIEKYIDKKV